MATLRKDAFASRARRYALCVGVPILVATAISVVYGSNLGGFLYVVPTAALFVIPLVVTVIASSRIAELHGPVARAARLLAPIAITYVAVVTLQAALLALPLDLPLDREVSPADPLRGLTFIGLFGSLIFGISEAVS